MSLYKRTVVSAARSECHQPRSDAVIVMLIPPRYSMRHDGSSDWCCTLGAIRSLQRLHDDYRAEVRFFHDTEDEYNATDLAELVKAAQPRRACTVAYELARNAPILGTGYEPWQTPMRQLPKRWGYSHMIRFFFVDLFETSALSGYKYWMRLDSDSFFAKDFVSPFTVLDEAPEIAYLHYRINGDCGGIVEGLGEFAQHWQDHLPGPSEATQGMLAQTRTSCSRGRSGPVPYSCTTPYEYLQKHSVKINEGWSSGDGTPCERAKSC